MVEYVEGKSPGGGRIVLGKLDNEGANDFPGT